MGVAGASGTDKQLIVIIRITFVKVNRGSSTIGAAAPVAAAAPAPVAVAATATAGPARTLSITGAVSEYDRILYRVNAGSFLTDALQADRSCLSFFSRKRCVRRLRRLISLHFRIDSFNS